MLITFGVRSLSRQAVMLAARLVRESFRCVVELGERLSLARKGSSRRSEMTTVVIDQEETG
jgi:hypothetical protein